MVTRERVLDERISGIVIEWKGRYGWIKSDAKIGHEEAYKHGGRVYVHIKDVDGRKELEPGKMVTFFAYADGDGVGAESVRVQGESAPLVPAPVGGSRRSDDGYVGDDANASPPPLPALDAPRRIPGMAPVPPKPTRSAKRAAAGGKAVTTAASHSVVAEVSAEDVDPKRWWQRLKGDCCPISLQALEELTYEPFGLLGAVDGDVASGLWGPAAVSAASLDNQAVHWFDGMFLASFLVSSGGGFIDPTNRRPLCRAECESLDEYLAAQGLPAVYVRDAYDLSQAENCGSEDRERIKVLEREAAKMLRSLFVFRAERAAAADGAPPPPPPRSRLSPTASTGAASMSAPVMSAYGGGAFMNMPLPDPLVGGHSGPDVESPGVAGWPSLGPACPAPAPPKARPALGPPGGGRGRAAAQAPPPPSMPPPPPPT